MIASHFVAMPIVLIVLLVALVILLHIFVDDVRAALRGRRTLKVKFTSPLARWPHRGAGGSAALDLAPIEDMTLAPGESRLCRTGVAVAVPDGYVGLVCARGSVGELGVSAWGRIDSDDRGEVYINLRNELGGVVRFAGGDYVAQVFVLPCLQLAVEPVPDLPVTAGSAYLRNLVYLPFELTPEIRAASETRRGDFCSGITEKMS